MKAGVKRGAVTRLHPSSSPGGRSIHQRQSGTETTNVLLVQNPIAVTRGIEERTGTRPHRLWSRPPPSAFPAPSAPLTQTLAALNNRIPEGASFKAKFSHTLDSTLGQDTEDTDREQENHRNARETCETDKIHGTGEGSWTWIQTLEGRLTLLGGGREWGIGMEKCQLSPPLCLPYLMSSVGSKVDS